MQCQKSDLSQSGLTFSDKPITSLALGVDLHVGIDSSHAIIQLLSIIHLLKQRHAYVEHTHNEDFFFNSIHMIVAFDQTQLRLTFGVLLLLKLAIQMQHCD